MLVLSNNPRVISAYSCVESVEGTAIQVLEAAQRYIYTGYTLYGHPLAGNARLCRNPYRSVALEEGHNEICVRSVLWIEDALDRLSRGEFDADSSKSDDYSLIDFDLFLSMIHIH
ncbi:GrdX family protein [Aminobacterium sp. MB27-C1]|uniref:GrdX family protein n=1 Tax=Aminobacterium sp. MB27-C1 TaxID=3070661 RepID=UPI0027DBB12D|nr:GrdX family protein [Aminobacterium sp. MB27-C1]WMI71609.1 GrdX family protein [Aminobacterium sp. MB27-C1]